MLKYFNSRSRGQTAQWARSLLPQGSISQADVHCRSEASDGIYNDRGRSHSSSSRGQGISGRLFVFAVATNPTWDPFTDVLAIRHIAYTYNQPNLGPPTCSHKWDPDLPAIIGRELLVRGAAQDVMKIMRSGNSLVEALQQPVSTFLAEAQEQPILPNKDSELGPPSFRQLIKDMEESIKAQNEPLKASLEAVIAQPHSKSSKASLDEEVRRIGRQIGISIEPTEDAEVTMELATKRTYQPSTIIRKRRHGFLSRLRSVGGRRVLNRRKLRGRKKVTA